MSLDSNRMKLAEVKVLQEHLQGMIHEGFQNSAGPDVTGVLNTMQQKLEVTGQALEDQITNSQQQLRNQRAEIDQRDQVIKNRASVIDERLAKLDEESQLMEVRDRMLQLSQEKNIYKQKVIYVLITLIIAFFLIGIVGYVYIGVAAA